MIMRKFALAAAFSLFAAASAIAQIGPGSPAAIGPGSGGGGGGGGGTGTITAGTTATSGFTSGDAIGSVGGKAVDLGTIVNSLGTSCPGGVAVSPATGAVTIGSQITARTVASTPPQPFLVNTDCGGWVYLNSATDQAPQLPAPNTSGFPAGWGTKVCNINSLQTLTPASGTIGGASTKVLAAGTVLAPNCVDTVSNGSTNWQVDGIASASPGGSSGQVQTNNGSGGFNGIATTGTGSAVLAGSPALTGAPTAPTQTAGDNTTDIATDAFVTTAVNNAVAGINPAVSVNAATTAAGDTSGCTYNNGVSGVGATFTCAVNTAITIDGFTFTTITTQSLLVKNDTQSPSGAFNGIYVLTALQTVGTGAIFTRRLDYDMPSDMNNTGAIPVISGTVNGTTSWILTTNVVTVGTTPLSYTQFSLSPTKIVTSVTCPGAGAASVGAVTCVVDYQLFTPGSGNWTKPTGNYTVTAVFGCGAGGSGGSGAITNSGTIGTGGGGGGSGYCDWKYFKTADLAGTVAYVVAATTTGGAAKTQTTATNGTIGNQGANTTFGAYTWYGGGGGQAGQNSGATSTGGAGGGPYAAGANQSTTGSCAVGAAGNGGGTGVSPAVLSGLICGTGGAGAPANGGNNSGSPSGQGATGGGSGGGITATPTAQGGGTGGQGVGCQNTGVAPAGVPNGATPAIATQDFGYHPGCGGGGGGGNTGATGTTAGSGAAGSGPGAGGGGGGVALAGTPANTSGAGGNGYGGVLVVVSY